MNQFWILALVALAGCIIMLAVDYYNSEKDAKSKTTLLTGYAIVFAAALLGIWGLNAIPGVLIYAVAVSGLVFFGRFLIRKAASRKQ